MFSNAVGARAPAAAAAAAAAAAWRLTSAASPSAAPLGHHGFHTTCLAALSAAADGVAVHTADAAKEKGLVLTVPTYCVWGANTDIGKSLVSAGICRAQALSHDAAGVLYLKPVQTGFPEDSDSRMVAQVAGLGQSLGTHALALHTGGDLRAPNASRIAHTEFAWKRPASPHVCVAEEGRGVSAAEVAGAVQQRLAHFALQAAPATDALSLVETAGGVASPGPCGRLQGDILRPLRLPGLLVGDARLGGISATVTAFESLLLRGYDTDLLVMCEGDLGNAAAIRAALGHLPRPNALAVVTLPAPPSMEEGGYEAVADWCGRPRAAAAFEEINALLKERHAARMAALEAARPETAAVLWWPFTQHSMVKTEDITVIDSRCGEHFSIYRPATAEAPATLAPSFDACASWWTQGVSAELQPAVTKAVAYAAGRYGHVMFPENTHAAALALGQRLVQGVGKGWAARVFYSDNGSTAIEVAIKMAFRKYIVDHDMAALIDGPTPFPALKVIGLEGCYHGDTLGAMDCQSPSVFTGDLQFPWYSGRGLWLEPPTVAQCGGQWRVSVPDSMLAADSSGACRDEACMALPSRDAAFVQTRDYSRLAEVYRQDIKDKLDKAVARAAVDNAQFGALILEPVVQGAGGMLMIDPLYQRCLMQACKQRRIPVILDEVFCGIWRLGRESCVELLHETPDVACYAKLLTAGALPLAATLATPEVFAAFEGDSKVDALLHGHSYTAHAIGCQVAIAALELYKDPAANPNWIPAAPEDNSGGSLVQMWDNHLTTEISKLPCIDRVFDLGTLFVCEVKPEPGGTGGYTSSRTKDIVKTMRAQGAYVRPLGSVLYIMATPTTAPSQCTELLKMLLEQLQLLQAKDDLAAAGRKMASAQVVGKFASLRSMEIRLP